MILINEAADDWDRVISSGHRDGITIQVEALSYDEAKQLGVTGNASIRSEGLVKGIFMLPTFCVANMEWSAKLCDRSNSWLDDPIRKSNFCRDYPLATFKQVAIHEIGHCLGIGGFSRFSALLEETPGYEYLQFVGRHAQEAFRESVGSEWIGPNVPMLDNAHWSPVLFQSPLTHSLALYIPDVVTTVDAAALLDLGYVVNMDAAVPTSVAVGRRIFEKVYELTEEGKEALIADYPVLGPQIIAEGYTRTARHHLGVEALLFPENPWPLNVSSLEFSSGPWTQSDDPSIDWDNVYRDPRRDIQGFWSSWEPRGAGKRTLQDALATVSWCGVGH